LVIAPAPPIRNEEVEDPIKEPFAELTGKVTAPLHVKVFPFKLNVPLVKLELPVTVILLPNITLPLAVRFILNWLMVLDVAPTPNVIVPNAPVPPIVNLEFPVRIDPDPVIEPLSVKVNNELLVILKLEVALARFRTPLIIVLPL
jgi:hypothetical protein